MMMKYPGLLLLLLSVYYSANSQQASTATALTSVNIIYPVGISIHKTEVESKSLKNRPAIQYANYGIHSHRSLPEIFIEAFDACYAVSIREEEKREKEFPAYRVTVHFN